MWYCHEKLIKVKLIGFGCLFMEKNMKKIKINNRFLKYLVSITALIVTLIFVFSRYDSFDIDGIWRFLVGRDISKRGLINDNPYSWINGTEWAQSEWLFDLMYYFIVNMLGMAGYVIMVIIPAVAIWTIGYLHKKGEKSAFLYLVFFIAVYISFPKDTASSPSYYSSLLLPILILGYLKKDSYVKKCILSFVSGVILSNFDLFEAVIIAFFLILFFITDQTFDLYNKKFDLKTCLKTLGMPFVYMAGMFVNPAGINVIMEGKHLITYYFDGNSYAPEKLIPSIVVILVIMTCGYAVISDRKKEDCMVLVEVTAAVILSFVSCKVGISAIYLIVVLLPKYFYGMFKSILGDLIKIQVEYHTADRMTLIGILIGIVFSVIVSIVGYPKDYGSYVHKEQEAVISDEMIECLKGAEGLYMLHSDEVADYLMWNGIPVMYDTRDINYSIGAEEDVTQGEIIYSFKNGSFAEDQFDELFKYYNSVLIDPSFEKSEWYFKYNTAFELVMTDECGNSLYIRR